MIKLFGKEFYPNRVFSFLVVFLLCISCGYQYIEYQIQFEKYTAKQQKLHAIYQEIRWETLQSILGVLNREGKLHSKLVAHIIRQDIINAYPDLSVLQKNFERDDYSDEKFTSIIVDTVASNGLLGEASSRNGVIINCEDKILYNLIISSDRFDTPLEDFILKNYNYKLAESSFKSIKHYNDGFIFIEPTPPLSGAENHMMLSTSSLSKLKELYLKEGLEGLSGYLIINPYYITKTGDIFNIPDFDRDGNKNSNHKIIVISYISIYDTIKNYHNDRIANLTKLEQDSIGRMNEELGSMYFSSIKSVLLHFLFIIIILLFTRYLTNKNNE